jgi:DNA-binding IclR family transcriptional regulator
MASLDAGEGDQARYAVPALERGLDILEYLAGEESGVTQSQIAAKLELSPGSIFRTLICLERRGYIYRKRPEDLYFLSLRLFELGHSFPPTKRLLDVAMPEMRALAAELGQACHLGVYSDGELLIVADVESPRPINLAFRIGARWPMATTVSGRVLLAHQPSDVQAQWRAAMPDRAPEDFDDMLRLVAERGYDMKTEETFAGLTDIGAPIMGRFGALAALTVSFVRPSRGDIDFDDVLAKLRARAQRISAGLGGANGMWKGTK